MNVYKSRHDGKEYYNHQIGSKRDQDMDEMKGDKSGKAKAESEHSKIEGSQEKGKGEDIHGVVSAHGPASKMEMEKGDDGYSVKTTHGGHVHDHHADGFDSAMDHAKSAFGEAEAEPEEAKNEKPSTDMSGMGNLGSAITA